MTAIIKNRFRLQNAKDFLENFAQHPRMRNGAPLRLTDAISLVNVNPEERVASAHLSFQWRLDPRITDLTNSDSNTQIKNDAPRGLIEYSGAHVRDRNHYLFVGKALPWGSTTASENNPPVAADTLLEEREVWHEMLSLKKIAQIDGTLVIPRVDWDGSQKTIYVPFDDRDANLYNHPTPAESLAANTANAYAGSFYVLTDDHHIFVCLENGGGRKSTVKPVWTDDYTNVLDYRDLDGYVWKYMGSVSSANAAKFLTDSWIPVRTLGNIPNDSSFQWQVEFNAKPGQVLSFIIDNPGSGYTKIHKGKFTNASNVNNNGTATLTALPDGTPPSDVEGYYVGAQIHIVAGADEGKAYDIVAYNTSNGKRELTVNGPWAVDDLTSEYTITPKIAIQSDSNPAIKILPIVQDGKLKSIKILERGLNASFVNATVVANSAQAVGGIQAKVRAVLSPAEGLGKDIEKDLGAHYVMLSAKLAYQEGSGDFPIDNDYRQIGIIRDVKNADGTLATANTLNATKRVRLSNISSSAFQPDENILMSTNGGTTWVEAGKVLEYAASTNETGISYMSFFKTLGNTTSLVGGGTVLVKGQTSNAQATVLDVYNEEVLKFSGEILYLENRRPILRSPDQIEDIKAIVEF